MAESGLAGDAVRRFPVTWNAPGVAERKRESERFEPWVMGTIGRVFGCAVVKAERLLDLDKSADFRLLLMLRDLVGCKMIGHLIAQKYPNIFRCRYVIGVANEFSHWCVGYPHWMFIGHKAPWGIVGWYVMDMGRVQASLPLPSIPFTLKRTDKDPTSFYMPFDVTRFPRGTVIAAGGSMVHLA
jgi:hypothetical protein